MSKNYQVLVLDDEPLVCERLQSYLAKKGFNVEIFTKSQDALKRLEEKYFDVVLTDMKMEGPTGLDVLRIVKTKNLATEVIIITGYASIETSREAEIVGAFEFIAKPFLMSEVAKSVDKAAKQSRKK